MNKITLAVIVALFAAPVVIPKAHAISAGYRAQLERSGCTQVTESNGTCDIHKTKAENQRLASAPATVERKKLSAYLEDNVLGASTDDAYKALTDAGFENNEPLQWVKGKYKVILDLNSRNQVISVILK